MDRYSEYHIKTYGFEEVIVGMTHMLQLVKLGRKCRIVCDYDPTKKNVTIETYLDKSDDQIAQEKEIQEILQNSKRESKAQDDYVQDNHPTQAL